jgi:uncharacterized protein with ParB-like and HNH nuclease domain
MKASESNLRETIQGDKQFIIPLFQRQYSWDKQQWEVLWNDIEELCSMENPHPHFMGSMVSIPESDITGGVDKYILIDGQQRLTTIFILICVLRNKAKEKNKDSQLSQELHNKFLINQYQEGTEVYKLQPAQTDREAFYGLIENKYNPDSNAKIGQCYTFFEKKIRRTDLQIDRIKKVISNHLCVVNIVLSTDDNPYLVFESLNYKGQSLTQADLVRNYFFLSISPDEQEQAYEEYWLKMQENLDDNLTEFIRHYLTKSGDEIKKDQIYFAIKEKIRNDALAILKDLYKFSRYYTKFLDPHKEEDLIVSRYLNRIKRLEVATVYPFLLNCYDDYQNNKLSKQDLISVFDILENFVIRRFVCNIQTRGLNKIFAGLYKQVSKNSNLNNTSFVETLKLDLQKHEYPIDEKFETCLLEVQLYGRQGRSEKGRSEKGKLILESIEESFCRKEQLSFEGLSIEHIMPQKLSTWWEKHLGEDYGTTHDLLIHSLGNLTLTAYNGQLSNNNFFEKKETLKRSHLEINKYFDKQESWKREDIEKRSSYLVDKVLEIWPYFGNKDYANLSNQSHNQITFTTPKKLTFFETYSVRSWRDVLQKTLNVIADLEPDKLEKITEQFPRFIGKDKKDFRDSRKLECGLFIEVNLSAKDIYSFCVKAIQAAEIPMEEWKVEND